MKLGGKFDLSDYGAMQTREMLDMEGEYIRLRREPEWVDDGEGGQIRPEGDGPHLAKQRFWFFEAAPIAHIARGTNFQDTIGMGQRTTTNYVLVGLPDANIRQDDWFKREDGYTYKVVAVHPDRREQTIAELERITDPQGKKEGQVYG